MELCVLHYHYRPGGVRQVIAAGLPALARAGGFTSVRLAGGEAPEDSWRDELERALHPLPVRWSIDPALGYWSESQPERAAVEQALASLASREAVLWAHNLSVGRNFYLTRAAGQSAPQWNAVWLHHHDWWWDGRWQRWPEMLAQGAENLTEAVKATLPAAENLRHFCVSLWDLVNLHTSLGRTIQYAGNPVTTPGVAPGEIARAKEWLRQVTGRESHWLYPCRMLRRKNIAEALLVQRWLAPEAATVTTGGPSSAAEFSYSETLTGEAEAAGWPLFAAVCARHPEAPSIPALIRAADAVVVTSLKEGFGLPYFEALLAGRPLYARSNAAISGKTWQSPLVPATGIWARLPVGAGSYDGEAEQRRTDAARAVALSMLPAGLGLRDADHGRRLMEGGEDFGRLSLAAQLEVLHSRPPKPAGPAICIRPQSGPAFDPELAPAAWAASLLQETRTPPEPTAAGWELRVREFVLSGVREWLDYPLLFAP